MYSQLSTVYLVTVNDGDYEQTIYVITPERKDAIDTAKTRTELINPKLSSAYKRRLHELEPEEREGFVGNVNIFEPESID